MRASGDRVGVTLSHPHAGSPADEDGAGWLWTGRGQSKPIKHPGWTGQSQQASGQCPSRRLRLRFHLNPGRWGGGGERLPAWSGRGGRTKARAEGRGGGWAGGGQSWLRGWCAGGVGRGRWRGSGAAGLQAALGAFAGVWGSGTPAVPPGMEAAAGRRRRRRPSPHSPPRPAPEPLGSWLTSTGPGGPRCTSVPCGGRLCPRSGHKLPGHGPQPSQEPSQEPSHAAPPAWERPGTSARGRGSTAQRRPANRGPAPQRRSQ